MLNILLAAEAEAEKWSWVSIMYLVFAILILIMAVIIGCSLIYFAYQMHLYNKQCGHQITIEEYLKESNVKYDWRIKNILYN